MRRIGPLCCLTGLLVCGSVSARDGADCAPISDDGERLACYDKMFRTATADAPPAVDAATAAEPGAAAEQKFGREQVERAQSIEPSEELVEITANVTDVKRRARNELVVYLSNGQVWAQTSPRYLTLRDGDGVIVRRGRMGGYILTTERGGSTRVKRVR